MSRQYTAFIPVRAGSKSIKLKNIRPIAGWPLVCWTIEAACGCEKIGEVCISTDGQVIRDCVNDHMGEFSHPEKIRFVERDPSTATDTASTESAMVDFASKCDFDHLILIQATSPLLESGDLDRGIAIYEEGGFDSVLSVVRQKRFHWAENEDGSFSPTNYDFKARPRRQEFDGYLVENGAFYITSARGFRESQCRLFGRIGVCEMGEETYFEIDEPSDWIVIEHLLKKRLAEKTCTEGDKAIRLLITDCDGVLTDGGMYYTEQGDELKKFNTKDGMGLARLGNAGVKRGIITGEDTRIVVNRANKLKLDYLYKGVQEKLPVLEEIVAAEGISWDEVAYIGDDVNDIACIKAVGLGIAVADARPEVLEAADLVLSSKGGEGAVREACEYILKRNQK